MKQFARSLVLVGILFSVVESPAQSPTWTDTATKLMWAGQDNGSDVNWNQAKDYCANLRLVGYSNWRLGTIDELAGINDQTQRYKIKGGIISTTSWFQWSSSAGNASGEAWLYYVYGGERHSIRLDGSFNRRALCVRRSGE